MTVQTRTRARALPPDERRSTIVDAVIPLLVSHGSSITTRQIADAAGVAEGTIFRVFADKDELLLAAIDRIADPAPMEEALADIDRDLPPRAQLVAAAALVQQRIVDVWRVLSAVEPSLREQRSGPLDVSPQLTALLTSTGYTLRLAPAAAARLFRSLTLATSHPLLAEQPMEPDELVDVFLEGVAV